MEEGRIKSWIEVLRSAKAPEFIKKLAWSLNLECKIEIQKRLFRETVFFEASGLKDKLSLFKDYFYKSMENI